MKLLTTLLFTIFLHGLSATEPFKHFPVIDQWQRGAIEHYTPNTLYNAINGGSELYLKFNFEGMTTCDYQHNDNYITVELYQHSSPIDAFGIYSMERPQEDKYINIGVQGFGEDDYIYFIAGKHYIKVRALKVTEHSRKALESIAENLDRQLNKDAIYPAEFMCFPEQHRVPFSDKYINENILGYQYLKHCYEVSYLNKDSEYTLFLLKGDSAAETEKMLNNYMVETNSIAPIKDKTHYLLTDRYAGDIGVIKVKRYLICSRGKLPNETSIYLLNQIAAQLEQL